MPGDLVQQIPYIRRALEGYRIPILQLEGYEADDVIGTLARKAAAESYPVFVVSSDKDMLQLVNDKVLRLESSERQSDLRRGESRGNSRRASVESGRCDGLARRFGRQHSGSSRNRRQGFGRI